MQSRNRTYVKDSSIPVQLFQPIRHCLLSAKENDFQHGCILRRENSVKGAREPVCKSVRKPSRGDIPLKVVHAAVLQQKNDISCPGVFPVVKFPRRRRIFGHGKTPGHNDLVSAAYILRFYMIIRYGAQHGGAAPLPL